MTFITFGVVRLTDGSGLDVACRSLSGERPDYVDDDFNEQETR
jgi:hypothetical protein